VFIPEGATTALFTVRTSRVATAVNVTITATANNQSVSRTLFVVPR
jgi:hypothetical protein